MSAAGLVSLLRRVAAAPCADADLLRAYAQRRDPAAFRQLVARHGPPVLSVCRRALGDDYAAEDAFQATFLLLARKAGSVRRPEALAAWLFGVARRVSAKARHARDRRRTAEARAPARPPAADPAAELSARELLAALDAELARLPAGERLPLALVYWQGLPQAEAANRLGLSLPALRGRLDRGRRRLAGRLRRRGLAPNALLLAPLTAAALPHDLLARTAALAAAPWSRAIPAAVLALTAPTALPLVPAVLLAITLAGVGMLGLAAGSPGPAASPPPDPPPPAAAAGPRLDRYGDPLPPRAIRRFGTTRFRMNDNNMGTVFRLSPDGRTLAGGTYDIHFWDAATGRRLSQEPLCRGNGQSYSVRAADFSPDGTRLLVIGPQSIQGEGRLTVLEVATARPLVTVTHPSPVWGAALSPDGHTLALSGHDGALRLLDAATGKLVRDFGPHASSNGRVQFSPDGRLLAAAVNDDANPVRRDGGRQVAVQLWDVATGAERRRITGLSWLLPAFAIAPDGATLATADSHQHDLWKDSVIRLWDLATGREKRSFPAPQGAVFSLCFTPDGQHLLSGGKTGEVIVWDVATGQPRRRFGEPSDNVSQLVLARDGRTLYTCGEGGIVRVWDITTGARKIAYDQHAGWIAGLAQSPDGRNLATAGMDGTVRLWDRATTRTRAVLRGHGQGEDDRVRSVRWVYSAAFTADGRHVITAGGDGTVRQWDVAAAQEDRLIEQSDRRQRGDLNLRGEVRAALSPDGRLLAVLGPTWLRLRELATGRLLHSFGDCGGHGMTLLFSPDGQYLAAQWQDNDNALGASGPPRVRVWSVATGQSLFNRVDQNGCSLAFTPDGRSLVYAVNDGPVRVFDLTRGQEQDGPWGMHGPVPVSSPGGSWGASVKDGVIRLTDTVTGREFLSFRPDPTGHAWPYWSADGKTLFTANWDGTVLEWDLSPPGWDEKLPPGITPAEADRVWADLASADAGTAYRASWRLLTAADAAAVLRPRLRPARAAEPTERVRRLIAELGHDKFSVREAASRELAALGAEAVPALTAARHRADAPEIRNRAEALLKKLPPAAPLSPEDYRDLRALEVLERTATPAARQLLTELAAGDPDARRTQMARAGLGRLRP